MTFKHKLSVRLALLKDALWVAPVVALVACEQPHSLVGPGVVVTRVAVSPRQVALAPNQTARFMAVALTATGDSANVPVTWSATGGSIIDTFSTGSNHYATYQPGPTPGNYLVIATDRPATVLADTGTVTVVAMPVAQVTVSPAVASFFVGVSLQLTAIPKDSAANPLTGRGITWSSSNSAVATVSGSGLVTGQSAGSATITATSEGKSGTAAVTVQTLPPASHAGYYVASSGSGSGDGSAARPWDLATALAQPAVVHAGDTIWIRGGTYRGAFTSTLTGTLATPIIVRQYPGEHATIDGHLVINGASSWYWGFEVLRSDALTDNVQGVDVEGAQNKLINLVVHDASGAGIGFWGDGGEAHGCITYNNGAHFNEDHGFYIHNGSAAPVKLVTDNIVFNNWAYNIHVYTETAGFVSNIHLDGNVAFGAATISSPTNRAADLVVLGTVPAQGIQFTNNFAYELASSLNIPMWVGSPGGGNQDIVVTGNLLMGGANKTLYMSPSVTATVSNNTLYSTGGEVLLTPSASGAFTWLGNKHYRDATASAWNHAGTDHSFAGWQAASGLGATDVVAGMAPSGTQVIVRLNKYEAGRANIIVYNWANASTVPVDLSTVLAVGDTFEIRNAQGFYGPPAVSGVYTGGLVSVPTAGITPPAPVGRPFTPAPVTGPTFNTFVVKRTGS